jgi:ABC-2 type transport system permease protein
VSTPPAVLPTSTAPTAVPATSPPAAMPASTRVKGPTALGDDKRRLLRLTWTLATTDFKLRFFGSALGYLWQLMRPLMLFGILYVVFTQFLQFKGPEAHYGVSLLLGLVLYNFFGDATGGSVKSILNREPLVRKIDFPRMAVPLSVVLQALFNLGLNMVPVLIFLLADGGRPRLSWLAYPVLVVLLATLGLALAMLLSSLYIRYRDIEPIWDVVLQALFYATPILYTVELLRAKAGDTVVKAILLINPFASLVQESKHVLIDPSHASMTSIVGNKLLLAIPVCSILALLAIGYAVFAHEAPRIAEDL